MIADGPGVDDEVAATLPRMNGEIAFEEPWQGRAFGTAVALVEGLGLEWDDFRRRLMAAIDDDPHRPYWDSWVVALDRLVATHVTD